MTGDVGKLGDSPEHRWLLEVLNRALIDVEDRIAVDMNLLMQMCAAEPKSAQFAIQFLAQDLSRLLAGRSVAEAEGTLEGTLITALGAIAYAYGGVYTRDEARPPPELLSMMQSYPLIGQCMEAMQLGNGG